MELKVGDEVEVFYKNKKEIGNIVNIDGGYCDVQLHGTWFLIEYYYDEMIFVKKSHFKKDKIKKWRRMVNDNYKKRLSFNI